MKEVKTEDAVIVDDIVPTSQNSEKDEENSLNSSLVQINKENIEFGAGIVGGIAGLTIGGPYLAIVIAIALNFSSKQENEVGDVTRAITKAILESVNYLTSLNMKYKFTDAASETVNKAVEKIKQSDDTQSFEKVESTLKDTSSKAKKLTEEYDLLTKGKQVLGTVGELADSAIVKAAELEKEYKVIDKISDKIKKTVASSKDDQISKN
eukprot:CAMPEP_0171463240 /NCGR_PEP_ID=MMETSP0945-20130129/6980_1 /TAXON_ID=109269 /ORGANISM="Vaucheria litorea, Strain CCMP2940" /LENGTH=208 /DNA_ID=CAMNT_0011989973 /DNA_START=165 /DNA_END=791 /DNA_ORIENTATION=-